MKGSSPSTSGNDVLADFGAPPHGEPGEGFPRPKPLLQVLAEMAERKASAEQNRQEKAVSRPAVQNAGSL